MKQIIALVVLVFGVISAHAEETAPTPAAPPVVEPRERHFFVGSGTRFANALGMSIFYHVKLSDQFMIGNSIFHGVYNREKSGGDLDNAQYYKDEYEVKTTMLDINATYYFREHGYRLWGFLLRGGFGHAWTTTRSEWGRYDRNPAFIIWGDDKRLRESQEQKKSFDSTFVRLGAYYQFAFNFNSTRRTSVGHVLEVGMGGVYFDRGQQSNMAKPNGDVYRNEFDKTALLAEVNYSLAF